jgi:hypothetical protein
LQCLSAESKDHFGKDCSAEFGAGFTGVFGVISPGIIGTVWSAH